MSQTSSAGNLTPSDWERVREAAEKFDQAWRESDEVDLAAFLPPPHDPLYGSILEELVKTDLEIRRSRRQAVTLDYYIKKYPKLGEDRKLPAKLIYEEYRVRWRFGDPVDLEQYRQRFPDQFAELQRLVERQPLPGKSETYLHASAPLAKAPAEDLLEEGDVLPIGGGIRLVELIGRGSFGEVWKVETPGGFSAAMKIIRPTLDGEEIQREARALEVLKRLDHPHLLKIQSAWQLPDGLYILMELAHCNLRERLKAYRKAGAAGVPVGELLRHFQEAAEALEYLHSQEILHRDVKPENLLLWHNSIKVADFGLLREQKQYQVMNTVAGVPLGTPGYMPPEAWRGAHCPASDQYSLALSYAELRLGRWPLPVDTPPFIAHLEHTPDLSRLGQAERDVLLRGLAKKPNERFPTCQALISALREVLPGDPSQYDLPAPKKTQQRPKVSTLTPPASLSEAAIPQGLGTIRAGGTLKQPKSRVSDIPPPISMYSHFGTDDSAEEMVREDYPPINPTRITLPGRWILRAALVFLLVVVSAIAAKIYLDRVRPTSSAIHTGSEVTVKPSFEWDNSQPERVILSAGSRLRVPIRVKWTSEQTEKVKLEASPQLTGLTVSVTEIEPNHNEGQVHITADANAVPGLRRLEVRATTKEQKKVYQVVVLPEWFEPAEDTSPKGSAVLYPSKIYRKIGKQRVIFVFVMPKKGNDKSFYLMENKVSNGMFRAFALAKPDEVAPRHQNQAGLANDPKKGDDEDYPVFGVTRPEAQRFAEWLKGKLPEARHLDLALGYFDGDQNDHREDPNKPIVAKSIQRGPKKLTECNDGLPYGILGLTGNGREWTSDNLKSEDGKDLAVLRGRSYMNPKPVTLADLDKWRKTPSECPVQYPDHRSWTTGFRVVIELANEANAADKVANAPKPQ